LNSFILYLLLVASEDLESEKNGRGIKFIYAKNKGYRHMRKKKILRKIESLVKNVPLIRFIYTIFGSVFFTFVGWFIKTNDRLILFSSFSGKNFNDSPKLIYYNIIRKYGDTYEYVWAFDGAERFHIDKGRKVEINSFKYFVIALKAKYWITNVNIERGFHFQKKKTVYINTWHGICLDFIGRDRKNRKDYNLKNLSFMCVSSEFDERIYQSAFCLKQKQFLRCGMPRNDVLIQHNYNVDAIKKKLGITTNKKIILYAPTWRENTGKKTDQVLDLPISIDKWKTLLENDYLVLFRAHSISKIVDITKSNDFFIDISQFPDVNEILPIVDILISDYSSLIIDFALLERPIFNFGYDYDEYKLSHGFYLDYEKEMPNGIIRDENSLLHEILNIDFDLQKEKTIRLKSKYFTFCHGNATQQCVEAILGKEFELNMK